MKEGIALFLLLLYEEKDLPQGLQSMRETALSGMRFDLKAFLSGTPLKKAKSPGNVFWSEFEKWKAGTDVSDEDAVRWMEIIDQ